MAKAAGIIITVVAVLVAASIGILLGMVLSKRIFRSQRSTSMVVPAITGVILLILVGLIVILFFPQYIHN